MNNPKRYSNLKATVAIAKASFRSMLRTPVSILFTLAFPLIFIIVFANIGGSPVSVDVAVAKSCDTINPVYKALQSVKMINLIKGKSTVEMEKDLSKGSIDAIIDIKANGPFNPMAATQAPLAMVNVRYTKASQKSGILRSVLDNITTKVNSLKSANTPSLVTVSETTITGREYKYIDFILPGMLGFSLMGSGVFGTAFVFLSLRLTLVIKRFFATPVKKYSIVLGEALARLVFALLGAFIIILIGHYAFGFTLINGFATVIDMLLLSALGLIIFMGFGFTISGIAKNESTVPPLSNIITLPQFLLSGTFFSTSAFPGWLQGISKVLPLTYLNDAMRKVAFEGVGITEISHQLLILGIWLVVIYAVAVKTFKWE